MHEVKLSLAYNLSCYINHQSIKNAKKNGRRSARPITEVIFYMLVIYLSHGYR